MAKEAYYFSHDANAQDDPKCMLLIDQMGMEGYGIFWALIERLRNETNYMLPVCVCNALAKRWGTSREKIETVIKNYGLFVVENDHFFSKRLKESMILKSEKARLSASYRWGNATALQLDSSRNANGMQKDANKRKESKRKKNGDDGEWVGVRFSEDGTKVYFKDGSFQELGPDQRRSLKDGVLQPHYVKKGVIE
jgi:hypothetical protein